MHRWLAATLHPRRVLERVPLPTVALLGQSTLGSMRIPGSGTGTGLADYHRRVIVRAVTKISGVQGAVEPQAREEPVAALHAPMSVAERLEELDQFVLVV
jgi:hypothetical protein